ncbi:MAG TPA: hypothetical protein VI776_02615 [Anaerolineales bacterium]|nr:hypothetical protein [Anaerolineales bacterium]
MKKQVLFGLAILIVLGGLFLGGRSSSAVAREPKILEFDSMVGVPSTLTGTQASAAFRGVNAGGLPWTVGSAFGELKASGKLEIDVQGLVFAAGPNTGTNTVASFRAIVSCLKSDGTPQNVSTGNFPATTGPASAGGGNAHIETTLSLPQPCFAPIVFVTSPGGAWFAVTGK